MVKWVDRLVSVLFRDAPQANNPLDDRFYGVGPGPLSRAGVRVSPDEAMKVSAVYRCVSILANVLAMFPKGMFERLERGRREAPDHPLDPIISFKPNNRQSAYEFWRQMCYNLALRQNAYAQIVPGAPGRGWVGQLIPLHPDRVRGPEELPSGRLRYEYTKPDGQKVQLISGTDIWVLQGLSSDGLRGLSMIDVAHDSIGVSLAAERHAARFFERGVKPTGVLESAKAYTRETAEEMGDSFGRRYGGEQGTGKVPVLWDGVTFKPLSMTLKDAEFLDSRKFSVAEIARWFGVPPHMVGDVERSTSWGTGIEQQGLHFLIYSLLPWIELLEQSIRFTLVVQPERFYPKFNVNSILRMDATTQANVFATLIDKGVLNPNECRELLERNPREGGDEYVNPAEKPAAPAPRMPEPEPDEEEDEPEDPEEGPETLAPVPVEAPVAPPPPQMSVTIDGRALDSHISNRMRERLAPIREAEQAPKAGLDLLLEEREELHRLAGKHAKDSEGWRRGVEMFYGRFASRIVAAGVGDLPEAKAWCCERRDVVLKDGGLLELSTEHPTYGYLEGTHAEG